MHFPKIFHQTRSLTQGNLYFYQESGFLDANRILLAAERHGTPPQGLRMDGSNCTKIDIIPSIYMKKISQCEYLKFSEQFIGWPISTDFSYLHKVNITGVTVHERFKILKCRPHLCLYEAFGNKIAVD